MVAGFQFIDDEKESKANGTLFQCAVHVGEVQNARLPEHRLDNRMALIAAGGIGLDGFSDDPDSWLYQRYFLGYVIELTRQSRQDFFLLMHAMDGI